MNAQSTIRLVAAISILSMSSFALAATQGDIGTTSTGSSDLDAEIPVLYKITDVADRDLGTFNGTAAMSSNDDVCIYSNDSGNYKVTATGSGDASAFTLTAGGNTLAYTVKWNDEEGTTGSESLTAGTAKTGQTGANQTDPACGTGMTANFEVTISQAEAILRPAGQYSGTLTFVIAEDDN